MKAKNKKMNTLKDVKEIILNSSQVIIVSHEYPDGDSIGSSIALWLALKKIKKSVINLLDFQIPDELNFLYGIDSFRSDISEIDINEQTVFVFLDCADIKRAGIKLDLKLLTNILIINIDHHYDNTKFGCINYIVPETAATGEIIFDLINLMGIEIDTSIATALYTAIVTDTGSFKFDNTTEKTFCIARQLLSKGVNISTVRTNLWESKSKNSVKILPEILATLNFTANDTIAYIVVTRKLLEKWDIKPGEIEGLVNYPKSIKGVRVAILFKETKDDVRVSFRSKDDTDVSIIAREFGGGGHKKASGCALELPLDKAIKEVINYTEGFIGDI